MDEKKGQVIVVATLLFISVIVLLHFIFSQAQPPKRILPSLTENLSAVTSQESSPENGTVPLFNALPTNSEIQASLADWLQKQETLKQRKAEKAEKAENVMAIVRGEKPAPPDPWKKSEPSAGDQGTKPKEKPDSIPQQELHAGLKSGHYFLAH